MNDIRNLSALDWASEMAALSAGESLKRPAMVIRLRYEYGDEKGYMPFLMPAGTYVKGTADDLITFVPADQEAGGHR